MRSRVWTTAALVLAACDQGTVPASDATWASPIGRVVATDDAFTYQTLDGAGPDDGRMTWVSVDDAGIDRAMRLETLIQPPTVESLQARAATIGAIEGGGSCWLHVEARAVKPQVELGLGRLSIMVRPVGDPKLPSLLERTVYVEPVWTAVDFSFAVPSAIEAGGAEIVFGVGTQLQIVDLGGVFMRCFDDAGLFPNLPETTFSYAGREEDAPWRATAQKQIERYRKGDLKIEVTDVDGQPVPDAEIHIQMAEHAFQFGTSIDSTVLAGAVEGGKGGQSALTGAYRNHLPELFNTVTFDDSLRWTAWNDNARRATTEEALAWVRSLGLGLRGRGLASAGFADLPPALLEEGDRPARIRDAMRAGVTETAGALAPQIEAWDVVDRPRDHHEILDLVGREEMAVWFRLARDAAPEARLALSESDILAGDRMAELATLIGGFLTENVPIDLIGAHGRFETQPPPIQVLSDRLDQLASFDLPLVITAFDMVTPDQALQADFTRDFLTLAFSHPSVEGFVFERFWEEPEAPQSAALYRRDGTIGPIGKIYRDLVLRDWWTDIVASSNVEGELISRVFQGDYTVSARKDGLSATAVLTVGPEGAEISLELAEASEGDRAL